MPLNNFTIDIAYSTPERVNANRCRYISEIFPSLAEMINRPNEKIETKNPFRRFSKKKTSNMLIY